VTPSVIQAWLRGLGGSVASSRMLLSLLSSVLGAAADDGLVPKNATHARSVKAPKPEQRKVEPWTAEQVAAVRAGMPERWQAMVDVGSGLGLRISEAQALAVGDIDFLRRRVHVRRQVKRTSGRLVYDLPKGGKERRVPLPDSVAMVLSAHIAEHPPGPVTLPWRVPSGKPHAAGLLFTMPSGKVIELNSWRPGAWHPALRAAEIEPSRDAGFHQLRHYYASSLLAGGVDIKALAEALGHHSAAFTLSVYAHVMPSAADRIRQAVDALSSDGTRTAQEAVTP
jgi:integrase